MFEIHVTTDNKDNACLVCYFIHFTIPTYIVLVCVEVREKKVRSAQWKILLKIIVIKNS